jgi:hypothetical protein
VTSADSLAEARATAASVGAWGGRGGLQLELARVLVLALVSVLMLVLVLELVLTRGCCQKMG